MNENSIIDRIKYFRDQRGWSDYRLAMESHLPYTTLQTMYKTTYTPTISTIQKLCDSFGITLAQFFESEQVADLTPEQQALISKYNQLSTRNREKLIAYLDGLCDQD